VTQWVERVAYVLGLREIEHLALEVVAALGAQARLALFPRSTRRLRPDHVHAATMRLGQQKRAERPAGAVEAVRCVPQPEEHLLDDLLGERSVTDDTAGEPQRRPRAAPADRPHRRATR